MGAVIGSKTSAAMTTPAIVAAKLGVFIVSDVATRNGHTTARNQDAATVTIRLAVRSVARDDSTRKLQGGSVVSIDAAARSCLVSRDHTVCHFEAGFRARYAQTTAPATTATVGDVTARNIDGALRENNVTVVAQGTRRCDHATLKVERAPFLNGNDSIYIALFACNDSAEIVNSVLVGLFASTKTVRRAFSYEVSE